MEPDDTPHDDGFMLQAGLRRKQMRCLFAFLIVLCVGIIGFIVAYWVTGPTVGDTVQERWLKDLAQSTPFGAVRATVRVNTSAHCNVSQVHQALAAGAGLNPSLILVEDVLFVYEFTGHLSALFTILDSNVAASPEYSLTLLQNAIGAGVLEPCLLKANFSSRVCYGSWLGEMAECSSSCDALTVSPYGAGDLNTCGQPIADGGSCTIACTAPNVVQGAARACQRGVLQPSYQFCAANPCAISPCLHGSACTTALTRPSTWASLSVVPQASASCNCASNQYIAPLCAQRAAQPTIAVDNTNYGAGIIHVVWNPLTLHDCANTTVLVELSADGVSGWTTATDCDRTLERTCELSGLDQTYTTQVYVRVTVQCTSSLLNSDSSPVETFTVYT